MQIASIGLPGCEEFPAENWGRSHGKDTHVPLRHQRHAGEPGKGEQVGQVYAAAGKCDGSEHSKDHDEEGDEEGIVKIRGNPFADEGQRQAYADILAERCQPEEEAIGIDVDYQGGCQSPKRQVADRFPGENLISLHSQGVVEQFAGDHQSYEHEKDEEPGMQVCPNQGEDRQQPNLLFTLPFVPIQHKTGDCHHHQGQDLRAGGPVPAGDDPCEDDQESFDQRGPFYLEPENRQAQDCRDRDKQSQRGESPGGEYQVHTHIGEPGVIEPVDAGAGVGENVRGAKGAGGDDLFASAQVPPHIGVEGSTGSHDKDECKGDEENEKLELALGKVWFNCWFRG